MRECLKQNVGSVVKIDRMVALIEGKAIKYPQLRFDFRDSGYIYHTARLIDPRLLAEETESRGVPDTVGVRESTACSAGPP